MKAWLMLLNKEVRMNKNFIFWGLVLLLGAGLLNIYMSYQSTEPISIVIAVLVTFIHVFYLPLIFLNSINKEWKHTAQIWLHLPQPGCQLLSAKLVAAIIAVIFSYCFTSLFVLGAGLDISNAQSLTIDGITFNGKLLLDSIGTLYWGGIYGNWILLGIAIVAISIYWTVWLMFIFIMLIALKRYIKKGLWLLGVIFLVGISKAAAFIKFSSWYETLTQWGSFNIPLFSMSSEMASKMMDLSFSFQTGKVLLLAFIIAILFFISSWLLDHRIEV